MARDQLHQDVGEIKGKLDTLLEFYEKDRKRLAAVERKVWYGSGAAAVLAVIASTILGKLSRFP
jgi:hypothetical protein